MRIDFEKSNSNIFKWGFGYINLRGLAFSGKKFRTKKKREGTLRLFLIGWLVKEVCLSQRNFQPSALHQSTLIIRAFRSFFFPLPSISFLDDLPHLERRRGGKKIESSYHDAVATNYRLLPRRHTQHPFHPRQLYLIPLNPRRRPKTDRF